jgi:hypothetical protein
MIVSIIRLNYYVFLLFLNLFWYKFYDYCYINDHKSSSLLLEELAYESTWTVLNCIALLYWPNFPRPTLLPKIDFKNYSKFYSVNELFITENALFWGPEINLCFTN